MQFVVQSPILYATPFVGRERPHKTQEGKLWLHCAEYGFSFCCAEIHESFGPIKHGEIVRIEVRLREFLGCQPFSLSDACAISRCADRMISVLFGHEIGTEEWDRAVWDHLGLDEDEEDPSMALEYLSHEEYGDLYYCVRRV